MAKIIGLFQSRSEAESAVHQLVNSGINRDYISMVSRDSKGEDTRNLKADDDTSGAAKGAGIGAALGGVSGLLAGLAGLAIPGIGPTLAAGRLPRHSEALWAAPVWCSGGWINRRTDGYGRSRA